MSVLKTILGLSIVSMIFPLLIFLFSGRLDWVMAWAVTFIAVVGTAGNRLLLLEIHPDLMEERANSMSAEGAKSWDRILSPMMAFTPFLVLAFSALDDRFDWSMNLPIGVQFTGLVFIALGYSIVTWAMVANRFFSGVVRIQKDRNHHVVESGPYSFVRHPGYLGSLIACCGFSLALGSIWALVIVLFLTILTVVRTKLEDDTLQRELTGYSEFAKRTPHRLIPGMW